MEYSEAFCLMLYVSDDGTESEVIWNSRDGVTPFVITLLSGKQATHQNWHKNVYSPHHKPKAGDRIFVDLTIERARSIAEANINKWEGDESLLGLPLPSVEQLVQGYMSKPGTPTLIVVT